jgi:small GTP-binding protein
MSNKSRYIVKICLLGEASVGKTSLVYRFVENRFRDNYGEVSAQIWDLGGQESFRSLRNLYLEGANGALVIYDVTNEKSFERLNEWIESFKNSRGDEPLLLIGNKVDLEDKIVVEREEGEEFANKFGMDFIITSAKTGRNVEDAFENLILTILDKVQ